MQVDLGGLDRLMTKPERDDRAIDARLEKVDGGRVSQRVRVEVSSQIRVRPSPALISEVEQLVGTGSVELR